MRCASRWAVRNNRASILFCDTFYSVRKRFYLKEIAKRSLCRRLYHAAFVPGIKAFDYCLSLGFKPERIWRGMYVAEEMFFHRNYDTASASAARDRLRLPERYFLCAARFSPEKNLLRLIEAYEKYRNSGGEWHLVIVGHGPEEYTLRERIDESKYEEIHLRPWQQLEDLIWYYRLASCFILPSIREPWGVAVNEATAVGLPILISNRCGCAPELCWRGVNGYDFDPYDANELARLMLKLSADTTDLQAMGKASRQIAERYRPENWANALSDCIQTVIEEIRYNGKK